YEQFTSGFCFFFQAEDGIRDLTVTGVQTCALPIYFGGPDFRRTLYDDGNTHSNTVRLHRAADGDDEPGLDRNRLRRQYQGGYAEIGRASCRERVYMCGVALDVIMDE